MIREITIPVVTKLQLDRLADILCNALEGGSNDWYLITDKIEPENWDVLNEPKEKGYHYYHTYPFNKGGALMIGDLEDDSFKPVKLDMNAMIKGLHIMNEKYPRHVADIVTENDDAITADIFLQCCIFGDAIYG